MSASFDSETTENASIQNNFASIERNDASIHDKTALIGKLKSDEKVGILSNKDSIDIEAITENVDIQQMISSKEVVGILGCQTTKARQILKTMEQQGVTKAITGKGKGKYILNISEDIYDK